MCIDIFPPVSFSFPPVYCLPFQLKVNGSATRIVLPVYTRSAYLFSMFWPQTGFNKVHALSSVPGLGRRAKTTLAPPPLDLGEEVVFLAVLKILSNVLLDSLETVPTIWARRRRRKRRRRGDTTRSEFRMLTCRVGRGRDKPTRAKRGRCSLCSTRWVGRPYFSSTLEKG